MNSPPLSPSSGRLRKRQPPGHSPEAMMVRASCLLDVKPHLPSGAAFDHLLNCGSPYRPNLRFHSIFFFYYTKEKKKSVSKTVSSNLFAGIEGFITRKIHPYPTRTHTCPQTPDKAPKNYLSHKSLFRAEGQGSFKDAPGFPLVLFTSFSLGPCLGPHCQPGE